MESADNYSCKNIAYILNLTRINPQTLIKAYLALRLLYKHTNFKDSKGLQQSKQ